jgi:hypothetical protein
MPDWAANLIKSVARAITTWVTIAWTWNSLNKKVSGAATTVQDEVGRIRSDALQALGLQREPETFRDRVRDSAAIRKLRELDVIGDNDMNKRNGWSFFKVILVLGIVIAVAVFILDRVLPKPYRDEELDEAWDDESFGDNGFGAPAPEDTELSDENSNGSRTSRGKRARKAANGGDETESDEE